MSGPAPEPVEEFPEPVEGTPAEPVDAPSAEPVEATPLVMERPHPLTPLVKGWMGLVAVGLWTGKDFIKHWDEPHNLDQRDLLIWGGLMALFLVLTCIGGLVSWRTTRFLIDDTQLRIEKNFLSKNSDRIPFSKIQSVDVVQPFAARLLGLAQLHIDAGAGEGRSIEYLGRNRAYELRDYLVQRAHGDRVTVAESAAHRGYSDVMADISQTERVLLKANPRNLAVSALLSTGILWLLGGTALTIGIGIWTGHALGTVAVLFGLATGLWGMISAHLLKQWNYSLVAIPSRSGRAGLKIARGLTSLTSQSVPTDRIQGINVEQDLFWRPFGLFRVRIDVLGMTPGSEDMQSNILLPAGTWDQVLTAIDAVWPGFTPDGVELHGQPKVSRWFSPLGWGYWRWGSTDEVLLTRSGWLNRQFRMIHHARVQSVHLSQGPLARRLHIADAKVDTTAAGFFGGFLGNLDEQVARDFALAELDLARAARERESQRRRAMLEPSPVAVAVDDPAPEPLAGPVEAP